jgi:hypothetical protein
MPSLQAGFEYYCLKDWRVSRRPVGHLTIICLNGSECISFLRNSREQSKGDVAFPCRSKNLQRARVSGTNIALAKPGFCLKYFVLALPRGVTVTQRPLEALFMVRIHAR